MRLTQIRDFLAVVDAGSIRAAARGLKVSQPALTKSIRQLEQELGAALVTRSVRGARPTDHGRAFLARARAVSADLLAVVPWQIAAREEQAGRLVHLRVREAMPAREISLFRRADVPPTPIARECAEILRALAKRAA